MYNRPMKAKIINNEEIGFIDILKGNFLVHRLLTAFYAIMFAFFAWYIVVNLDSLFTSLSALIMGLALLIITAWIGFVWPFLRAVIWYIKLRIAKQGNVQKFTIYFYDLYLRVENETLDGSYKIEYKDIYKVVETKKQLLITFAYSNYVIIKKSGFVKDNDLTKLKGYLARFNLVRKPK